MKKLMIIVILMCMFTLMGCEVDESTERAQNQKQEQLLEQSNAQIGMPNIVNFKEKRDAKLIWELRDDADLITYAYFQNMDGQFIYLGQCMGYGLPYTTQYTNPDQLAGAHSEASVITQADPNGLYSSETTNATWLMLLNEETGEVEVVYSEPSIVVTQSKLPARLVADWSKPDNY